MDVRASNAFASSYPAVLNSDTYDYDEYIRMIVNSGFTVMLWFSELRESNSVNDFMRRSQPSVLSAQTLYNFCTCKIRPDYKLMSKRTIKGELMDSAKEVEADIRRLFEFRMSLIPYLYNAFADYHYKGIPPFRAIVMDYPQDKNTFKLSDEYMIVDGILALPLTGKMDERKVYLPTGTWFDFNTSKSSKAVKNTTLSQPLLNCPYLLKKALFYRWQSRLNIAPDP